MFSLFVLLVVMSMMEVSRAEASGRKRARDTETAEVEPSGASSLFREGKLNREIFFKMQEHAECPCGTKYTNGNILQHLRNYHTETVRLWQNSRAERKAIGNLSQAAKQDLLSGYIDLDGAAIKKFFCKLCLIQIDSNVGLHLTRKPHVDSKAALAEGVILFDKRRKQFECRDCIKKLGFSIPEHLGSGEHKRQVALLAEVHDMPEVASVGSSGIEGVSDVTTPT